MSEQLTSIRPDASFTGASDVHITFAPSPTWYVKSVTEGDRLRGLANSLADLVARAMTTGASEAVFLPWAEAADELARMADFIEPPIAIEYTYRPHIDGNAETTLAQH